MPRIIDLIQDGSDSTDLCSEQQMVREVSSYTPALFAISQPDESVLSNLGSLSSRLFSALTKMWGPDSTSMDHFVKPGQEWFWTPEWQAAEKEVEADLAAGRFETFDNMEDFLAGLE